MNSEIYGEPATKPIEERVPPDLLWGFRLSTGPNTLLSGIPVKKAMKAGAESYTKIVMALIDRCLASEGEDIQYNSVLDVSDLVSLEEYKIVTRIR